MISLFDLITVRSQDFFFMWREGVLFFIIQLIGVSVMCYINGYDALITYSNSFSLNVFFFYETEKT